MVKVIKLADEYRARGHTVRILSTRRIEVTDKQTGTVYRVTLNGRVLTEKQLREELQREREGAFATAESDRLLQIDLDG